MRHNAEANARNKVQGRDQQAGNGVALDEFRGAVQRSEE